METHFERSILAGPPDEDVANLRAMGWRPESSREIAERRAQQEREQAERLAADPRWRRGRLRDVIGARHLALEFFDHLNEAIEGRRVPVGTALPFDTVAGAGQLTDSMPSSEVAITLKTAYHRNPSIRWMPNDIHDIDALSVAVPYCDVVVTEKHAHHILTSRAVDKRARTRVLRCIEDLTALLGLR